MKFTVAVVVFAAVAVGVAHSSVVVGGWGVPGLVHGGLVHGGLVHGGLVHGGLSLVHGLHGVHDDGQWHGDVHSHHDLVHGLHGGVVVSAGHLHGHDDGQWVPDVHDHGHGIVLGHHAAHHVVAHEGSYVAANRGSVHVAPLAGHIQSAASINLQPAPGTL